MSPNSEDHFCQLLSDSNESRRTIGGWFSMLYIDTEDWEGESDYLSTIANAEDYLISQLLEAHELPAMSAGDCPFSAYELSRAVKPSIQLEIWNDMTAKFQLPAKV